MYCPTPEDPPARSTGATRPTRRLITYHLVVGRLNSSDCHNLNVNRIPAESTHLGPGDGLSDLPDRTLVAENVGSGDLLVQSTEDWTRLRQHVADDDGILDESLPV